MKAICAFFVLISGGFPLLAQTPTEIYLFSLRQDSGAIHLEDPINISLNSGKYDNQPFFVPGDSSILFSSEMEDAQTDIKEYSVTTKSIRLLTSTAGSEYSPTVTPEGSYFSTIILKPDGEQLLWKYPLSGGEAQLVVPQMKIGYHCWFNPHLLAVYVLGDSSSLHIVDIKNKENFIVTENIGRSLHKIPGKNAISYLQIIDEKQAWIRAYYPDTGDNEAVALALDGSQDYAWTPDGKIIMGQGTKVFAFDPQGKATWTEIADLSLFHLKNVTRIAINSDYSKAALVVEE